MSSKSALQLALFQASKPQYLIARDAGMSETRLSRIASGRVTPTPGERASIAAAVGRPEDELFVVCPAA